MEVDLIRRCSLPFLLSISYYSQKLILSSFSEGENVSALFTVGNEASLRACGTLVALLTPSRRIFALVLPTTSSNNYINAPKQITQSDNEIRILFSSLIYAFCWVVVIFQRQPIWPW